MSDPNPPRRIRLSGGDENDVFRWRRFYCYTQRPGVCRWVKRKYARRLRRVVRLALRMASDE